jgi:anti-sigma regulatory factor (Ser/Thr protein kinase)
MILQVSLNLPADPSYVAVVRAISTTAMAQLGVAPENIADAALVIGEVCANVVRHAASTAEGRYTVEICYHAEHIDLLVRDHGQGFRRSQIPVPTPGRAGGWGLWLVESLADGVVFEPVDGGGTAVRVRLNIRYLRSEGKALAQALDR